MFLSLPWHWGERGKRGDCGLPLFMLSEAIAC